MTDSVQTNIDKDTLIKNMEWPTKDEVDEIVKGMVTAYVSCGFDAKSLKLQTVLSRFNEFGYTGNFMVI